MPASINYAGKAEKAPESCNSLKVNSFWKSFCIFAIQGTMPDEDEIVSVITGKEK